MILQKEIVTSTPGAYKHHHTGIRIYNINTWLFVGPNNYSTIA